MTAHFTILCLAASLLTAGAATETDALREAIISGNVEQVRLELKRTGQVNRTYRFGTTPIQIAVLWGKADVAKLLLENGANPNAQDIFATTTWGAVNANTNAETREALKHLLLKHGVKPDMVRPPEAMAAGLPRTPPNGKQLVPQLSDEARDRDEVRQMKLLLGLEAGFHEFNLVNQGGRTFLMSAAENGNIPLVQFFLEKGSHVGVKDFDGKTAIDYVLLPNAGASHRPQEVRERLVAILQAAQHKPANGAGIDYAPAPRPLDAVTARREADLNPQPLTPEEALAAFPGFFALTEYQQMVLADRAARWLRGNEAVAAWVPHLLVANTNRQVQLPLVFLLLSAQNNKRATRDVFLELMKSETNAHKLHTYRQFMPVQIRE